MTSAQRRRLASLAAHADTGAGLDRLVAWVDAYADRPRGPVPPHGTITIVPEPPRPSTWWRRFARLLREGH